MSFRAFLFALAPLTLLVLLTFFGLRQLNISVGTLLDWLIGVGVFWWLAAVTVLPWNTHFAARDLVEEARVSREKGLVVPEESVAFVRRVAKRFLWLAVGLHLLSAAVLFGLARYQLVAVGYPAAIAALVLTLARPAQRGYEYLADRLRTLSHQLHYPREDVVELRDRVTRLEADVKTLLTMLDFDDETSWLNAQQTRLTTLAAQLDRLDGDLAAHQRHNTRDHEQLARQITTEIGALSEDARFLNQVRELIRFVRTA